MTAANEMGKLPEGWRRVRLGDVCKMVIGGTPSRDNLLYWDKEKNTNNLWVSIKDMDRRYIENTGEYLTDEGVKHSNAKLIPPNTVLLSFKLTIGKISISKKFLYTNEAIAAIITKNNELDNLFLFYGLHKWDLLQDVDQAVKGMTLNKNKLQAIKILYPSSLPEQRKIAEILETVDNAIERTATIIEKYKRIKQGLMQDLLTRGVVENDKLGVMNYELRDEKKHRFKDSPLGRIPEEWEVVTLNDGLIDDIYRYPTFYNIKFLNEGIGVLKVENISEDGLINQKLSEINYISKETNDRFPKTILKENDLIMAVRGATIGKIALVTKHFVGFNINPNLIKISVNQEKLEPKFFWTYMNSHIGKNIFESKVSSTAKQTITVPQFLSIEATLPSLPEQRKIAEILYQIDETIEKEQKYKQKLEKIKQGLMDDLLTGKVRVNLLIKDIKDIKQEVKA